MESLIEKLSNEDLEALKVKYAGIPSIATLIEGALEVRAKDAETAKVKLDFESKVLKLAKLPAPPEGVYNVYLRWGEVDEAAGEPEMVNGEMRQPTIQVKKWIVEVNKSMHIGKGITTTKSEVGKRAVRIYKHNAMGVDVDWGVFASYADFAKSVKLEVGADSARRAVERDGYYGVAAS